MGDHPHRRRGGFFAGLFGAGGSAVGTPLLHLVGVPAFVALASPLPTAVPVALASSRAYWRRGFVERRILVWSVAVGFPATVVGALVTPYVGGRVLVRVVEVVVAAIGVRLALFPHRAGAREGRPPAFRSRMVGVAAVVGFFSGLLANKRRFPARSPLPGGPAPADQAGAGEAASAVLALPGTVTHWLLGHIDWRVVLVYTVLAVPAAYLGARLAIRANPGWLTRAYGVVLVLLAVGLLLSGRGSGIRASPAEGGAAAQQGPRSSHQGRTGLLPRPTAGVG
ncbi:sulfite exporter TauE/SafE family protein [Micromonospora orduensis]|uniref:sulfite exporter TauE/SafE family protein n=1 Tax=Micromonospora orduensis TaxID=1420891 RepID=UPI00142EEACB|nr:sulfite exporter TauE/SafE family protein [Micromonospora orduensis]